MRRSLSVLLLCISACAGMMGQDRPTTPDGIVREGADPARIVDLRSGEDIEEVALISELSQARVVYLGERHDEVDDHAAQFRLIRALHRGEGNLAIGLEMVQEPFQEALDAWRDGLSDEENFRRETEWDNRWGFDIRMYRPILELSRSRHIDLVALNAPSEVTRRIARDGLASLSEEERSALPELVLDHREHREYVMAALEQASEGHSAHMNADQMYEAQVVWDETMAQNATESLETHPRVIVLAGRAHIEYGLGIPRCAERRGASPSRTVLMMHEDDESLERVLSANPPVADYLWIHEERD